MEEPAQPAGEEAGKEARKDAARDELTPSERQARRERLAAIFGDVLPDQTRDDAADPQERVSGDDWLRAQVPPHHG